MIPSYPKILALGHKDLIDIFDGEIEITEKLDGSHFAFGLLQGRLCMRSKGQEIFLEKVQKLFKPAVDTVLRLHDENKLEEGVIYYGETLHSPKHNTLKYDVVPRGHIAIFAIIVNGKMVENYDDIATRANYLGIEAVPLLGVYDGKDFSDFVLDLTSNLGGCKIEGIVIKNYSKGLVAKLVSEEFKEVHGSKKEMKVKGPSKFDEYKSRFRTEARWAKAVQHLTEKEVLTNSPSDIGPLLKEINEDVTLEEKDNIQEWLWNNYGKEVLKHACYGFPQWYKEKLLEKSNG